MTPRPNESETNMSPITTIFFDIGGVCLSNGWDHEQRQALAQQLGFDYPSFDSRHRQVVDSCVATNVVLEHRASRAPDRPASPADKPARPVKR